MSISVSILLIPTMYALVIGMLGGLVGVWAVLGKRVFFTESVTHGTFPGAVLGVAVATGLGMSFNGTTLMLFLGAALFCLPLSWVMHVLARVPGISDQAAAGIVLTVAFALGYFLNMWFSPLPIKVESFLVGSLVSVRLVDLIAAGAVLLIAVLLTVFYGHRLIAYTFDPVHYRAAELLVPVAEAMILVLLTATVVVMIPAVGTVLPIALIAGPAAGLVPLCASPRSLLVGASAMGAAVGLVGFGISVVFQLSSGGTIALTAGAAYLFCAFIPRIRQQISR